MNEHYSAYLFCDFISFFKFPNVSNDDTCFDLELTYSNLEDDNYKSLSSILLDSFGSKGMVAGIFR